MVATTIDYLDPRVQATGDPAYSGVGQIFSEGFSGTGTLLFDGRTVLTAAHIFPPDAREATVVFDRVNDEPVVLTTVRIQILPNYDGVFNNDIALLTFDTPLPADIKRHELYRANNEVGQRFEFVGYGRPGTGAEGVAPDENSLKLVAENRFDIDAAIFSSLTNSFIDPVPDTQLLADFDNGAFELDSLGRLLNLFDRGVGDLEGMITPGDSGGPAFINDQIAGVASYLLRTFDGRESLDIDNTLNSSFGELGGWQRVGAYQQQIDEQIRANLPDAPQTPEQVRVNVLEGEPGDVQYAYFILQFSEIVESDGPVSVAYQTRNGTALSSEDYLAVSGRVNIYSGEQSAVIPVEILSDNRAESDESFWLDVFDPVGGSFPENQIMLSAARIIIDDDIFV